jgi:hypothetical protein
VEREKLERVKNYLITELKKEKIIWKCERLENLMKDIIEKIEEYLVEIEEKSII